MTIATSLIVDYGGSSSVSGAILELDAKKNLTEAGEIKTSFAPNDITHFLLHHSPALRLNRMDSTDGTIFPMGNVNRLRTNQLLFPYKGIEHQSKYSSISSLSPVFYGKISEIFLRDNHIIYSGNGVFPVIADVSFDVGFKSYRIQLPNPVLEDGATYPVVIVAYMEDT